MTASNTLTTPTSHNTAAITTDQQTFVLIPNREFLSIVWKLKRIVNTASHLHEKLASLRFGTVRIALQKDEVGAFCDVLHDDLFVDLETIIEQLEQSNCLDIRTMGRHLRRYFNHLEFILNYLFPDPSDKSEHRDIRINDIETIFLIFEEVRSGLYRSCAELEESIADSIQGDTYEISIANRVKAIQPKFNSLHDKYIFPGGSQLLTDPKSLGTETETLRNEVRELRNRMPIESEEGMDLGLVIDQLDFLIRLINSGFEFKGSDLITVSHLVDQAGSIFGCSLQWLELDEGGNLAEDTRH